MTIANPWTKRVWQHHRADNLTRAYRDVLLTLATFRGAGGEIHPAHATLAGRAKCSVRTVARALVQGAALGLVSWRERRKRVGWRALRSSNAYTLDLPDEPVRPGLRPKFSRKRTAGQIAREGENQKKEQAKVFALRRRQRVLAEMQRDAATKGDLLTARRKAVTLSYIEEARRRLPASSPPLTRPYGFGA